MSSPEEPLYRPTKEKIAETQLAAFARECGFDAADYAGLHRHSVEEPEAFWAHVWSFCDVIAETRGDTVLENGAAMPGARWFPEARLNFAENLLRRRDDATALVFRGEDQVRRELSFATLADQVGRLTCALRGLGVEPGDRVAGYIPNFPEAVVAMLAAASLGAIWSSCSPDFGPRGVVDRFGQIDPKILFASDGYFYNGRHFDSLERLPEILEQLPSVEHAIVISYDGSPLDAPRIDSLHPKALAFDTLIGGIAAEPEFEPVPFDHPLYILYSSGTTGKPKCIVHGVGGTLLQHLKEHRLHVDLTSRDRLFYFTTCGWMMWNWLVSGLASGATLVLYDGSPSYPDASAMFELAEHEAVTVFGTSAKFLDAAAKSGIEPRATTDLGTVRTILSTGSPLLPEGFDYVYQHVKPDVALASISGGTDIVSCFVLGNPTAPVWRGEIQCPGLGMKVEVWNDEGSRVRQEEGELVCTAPFPSMPVGFWNDADGERYRAAYFETYPGVWRHGDWIRETARGGYVISGRSDAVLNPGGVRIGTAEIYRQVERLDEVVESIAVGQAWEGDVRVVLFVKLRESLQLDEALRARIRSAVRANATPRHVPARIAQVEDIPRTRSGKITELAVRETIHGRPVKNVEALANPEALAHFRDRTELRD